MKKNKRLENLAEKITEENEDLYILALRKYYRENFANGVSNESFIIWIEGKLGMNREA